MELLVKKLHKDAVLPQYKTDASSGFDLYSVEDVGIPAGTTKLVKTGLAFQLPEGTEMQIRGRSGLSLTSKYLVKHGTVDEDYRGEVGVIVHNLGDDTLFIEKGDRFAQGVVQPVIRTKIREAFELSDTNRGAGGFGSTGSK